MEPGVLLIAGSWGIGLALIPVAVSRIRREESENQRGAVEHPGQVDDTPDHRRYRGRHRVNGERPGGAS